MDENALYLVDEGDDVGCSASVVNSKLVITNTGIIQVQDQVAPECIELF